MASTVTCPELVDILADEECLENFAGLGTNVYVGLKSELSAPLTLDGNEYSTPEFVSDRGLYKVQCKDGSQQISSQSNGENKGFSITGTFVIDRVNKNVSTLMRAINNRDFFVIFKDGDVSQILYDENYKIKKDSGAVKTDTGAKADDDRVATVEIVQTNSRYPNLYVKEPEKGWDSKLHNANTNA